MGNEDYKKTGGTKTSSKDDSNRKKGSSRKRSLSPEKDSGSGSVEISASIEETNRIRIKCGLKPLNADPNQEKNKSKAEIVEENKKKENEKKTQEITSKLEHMKKKRLLNAKISGPTLGEGTDESIQSWVERMRVKEKELAKKREKMLNEVDQEVEYSQENLAGLKVKHKMEDLVESGESVVLTLKDTPILKGNDLNEEEDELESSIIKEKERREEIERIKKKKPLYDIYDDSQKDILPQYNEPKQKETIIIGQNGIIDSQEQKRLDEINSKLANSGKILYSLETTKNKASEYYTEQEMIQFKKPKKKKKKLREKLEIEPLDSDSKTDHGSRTQSAKIQADNEKEVLRQKTREANYNKALEKAADESRALFSEENDEDVGLMKAIKRAGKKSKRIPKKLQIESYKLLRKEKRRNF